MPPHEDLVARLGAGFQVVVDGPLVLAFAALGQWPGLVEDLGGVPVVAQNTPAEIRQAWADSTEGSEEIDETGLAIVAIPEDDGGRRDGSLDWRPLSEVWKEGAMSDARANGLASAFVTAYATGAPFLSHAPQASRAVKRRFGKMSVIGVVECLHAAVEAGRIDKDAAWRLYLAIAARAGAQEGWPVPHSHQKFLEAMS